MRSDRCLTTADTAARFVQVNDDLAAAGSGSVSVGLAELRPADTVADLIARADAAMYAGRTAQPGYGS